jgi:prepilin-type N-terminal cleavage/methylation domain-containing protein
MPHSSSIKSKNISPFYKCCGFTLLEVVIAMFVLSFGLFGIMGICISSLKNVETSYERSLSTSLTIEKNENQPG